MDEETKKELEAMQSAVVALEPLDAGAQIRALQWLGDRLGYEIKLVKK